MYIVINDFSGHPFQIQLSRELASRGFNVTHLFSKDIVGAKGNLTTADSDPDTLAIEGLTIGHDINRYNFLKRLVDERKYGQIVAQRILQLKPDIVICSNTPLDSLVSIRRVCRKRDIPFIFWLQDVLGIATRTVLSTKLGLVGRLIGEYYIALEKRLLRSSHHVIPISADFLEILNRWGVPNNRTSVINNWAPLDEIPKDSKANCWAIAHDLDQCPVVLYSGALGLKHNPTLLLDLAKNLDSVNPDARLVVISEGYGADWLREQNRKLGLRTLIQLPFQPFSELPRVLASADVLLAILEPEAGEFCVPSKVLSYMCVERPIVLAASAENLASKLLVQNQAGLVTAPNTPADFTSSVMNLLNNAATRSQMGQSARQYAEQTFDIKKIGDKFESILVKVLTDYREKQYP
ncbi:MAG: glycosyltransferase WbuB [Pseudomonadales bacterium]|nr:glycosyltransferase WbuB [Pseudomonadales bacterium]